VQTVLPRHGREHPWPILPGKNMTAGPFYIVWQNPQRSAVAPEQWPYAIAELEGVESPAHRWPQLRLNASVPADAPAGRGQEVFVTLYLACHINASEPCIFTMECMVPEGEMPGLTK
jgi:hypothetical protein